MKRYVIGNKKRRKKFFLPPKDMLLFAEGIVYFIPFSIECFPELYFSFVLPGNPFPSFVFSSACGFLAPLPCCFQCHDILLSKTGGKEIPSPCLLLFPERLADGVPCSIQRFLVRYMPRFSSRLTKTIGQHEPCPVLLVCAP